MRDTPQIEFVREGKIDAEVYNDAAVIKFGSKQEEQDYVTLDCDLIERIKEVYVSFGAENGKDVHHIEDWWPNHLRGIECDPSLFRTDLLIKLQQLLTGVFARWRVIIHYYRGLSGAEDCGSALVLSDRIMATKGMKKILR